MAFLLCGRDDENLGEAQLHHWCLPKADIVMNAEPGTLRSFTFLVIEVMANNLVGSSIYSGHFFLTNRGH